LFSEAPVSPYYAEISLLMGVTKVLSSKVGLNQDLLAEALTRKLGTGPVLTSLGAALNPWGSYRGFPYLKFSSSFET